jgi:hypothetical protein
MFFPSYPCGFKKRGRRKSLIETELGGDFPCYPCFPVLLSGEKKKKREGGRGGEKEENTKRNPPETWVRGGGAVQVVM